VHHTAYGGGSIGHTIETVIVVAAIVWLVIFWLRNSVKKEAQAQAAARAHFQEVSGAPLTPIAVPELGLQQGEVPYYASEARVLGTHTRTRRVGYSGGPSFRVARGVYWHASSYASTPVRESYTAVDDDGQLIVTNERVVFVGQRNSFSWPLPKILSIRRFTDGVQINPLNRRPVVFTTGSEDAGIIIDRARSGSLAKSLSLAPGPDGAPSRKP
jgi:hypothetical protein